jgi:exosortase/archaeosortase family protein
VYKPGLAVGPVVLGVKYSHLPYTGFSTVAYILLALGLMITGLLLARLGQDRSRRLPSSGRRERLGRALAAISVAGLGVLLLTFSGWWRGIETWSAAHSIHLVTQHPTTAVARAGIVVLHESPTTASLFALTSQCTVAAILGTLLIGGAPLLLVRRLSVLRVTSALFAASLVLVVLNLLRLTAIGVAVLAWGHNGFALSHTYLGSLITFIGTCLAGVTFALVLLARQRPLRNESATLAGGAACT